MTDITTTAVTTTTTATAAPPPLASLSGQRPPPQPQQWHHHHHHSNSTTTTTTSTTHPYPGTHKTKPSQLGFRLLSIGKSLLPFYLLLFANVSFTKLPSFNVSFHLRFTFLSIIIIVKLFCIL
jgi:hypothetical protein